MALSASPPATCSHTCTNIINVDREVGVNDQWNRRLRHAHEAQRLARGEKDACYWCAEAALGEGATAGRWLQPMTVVCYDADLPVLMLAWD
eukprot:1318589-Pleurochrysis_carterae.AAC.2